MAEGKLNSIPSLSMTYMCLLKAEFLTKDKGLFRAIL